MSERVLGPGAAGNVEQPEAAPASPHLAPSGIGVADAAPAAVQEPTPAEPAASEGVDADE